ncbi:bifunctional DNA primase/polymerase [Streptomyces sp. NPDC059740]|uniref:bifunctional DNA primase/polymerase n=1 Tax=Streptomyces sp. NPDC059740 TaxID=3346926 RepID=UPI003661B0BE
MREIPGRRRKILSGLGGRPDLAGTALLCATRWGWPVVPGAGPAGEPAAVPPSGGGMRMAGAVRRSLGRARRTRRPDTAAATLRCACEDPGCVVPGAHPFDPGLLAATTDERMVRWWWTRRPDAPVVLATGGRAPCALSLPAEAGAPALAALDHFGVPTGPVLATPTRWALLVAPYSLGALGELLNEQEWVPSSLRFHGEGGYLALPPSPVGTGRTTWVRPPLPGPAAPWLPDVATIVDALVRASVEAPDGDSRLAY